MSYFFNGSNQYIYHSLAGYSGSSRTSGSFTRGYMSAFFKPSRVNVEQCILSYSGDTSSTADCVTLAMSNANLVCRYRPFNSTEQTITLSGVCVQDRWQFAAVSFQGATSPWALRLDYMSPNYTFSTVSGNGSTLMTGLGQISIGARRFNSSQIDTYFGGYISQVHFLNELPGTGLSKMLAVGHNPFEFFWGGQFATADWRLGSSAMSGTHQNNGVFFPKLVNEPQPSLDEPFALEQYDYEDPMDAFGLLSNTGRRRRYVRALAS